MMYHIFKTEPCETEERNFINMTQFSTAQQRRPGIINRSMGNKNQHGCGVLGWLFGGLEFGIVLAFGLGIVFGLFWV